MGYEGCWCVYYLGSHRCLGRHLGVEGVEGVAGNVYRNRKAVFCAVDRTMRMCLSANRLLGLGENARREVKRSKQTSLAVATCARSISISYGIFGMRVWIERTPDLLSKFGSRLGNGIREIVARSRNDHASMQYPCQGSGTLAYISTAHSSCWNIFQAH